MKYNDFFDQVRNAVNEFKRLVNGNAVRIISHLDSDGLSSVAILSKSFKRENIDFSISIVKQLNEEILKELSLEEYKIIFFSDLGSANLSLIEKYLGGRSIFVLDHHKPENFKSKIIHVNPHLCNVDGGKEISGSGVVYFFCKFLNEKNMDMAHISIIGAIGDTQESRGFSGLNDKILADAISMGKIEVRRGLAMFGIQTRPIHKVLEYSTDPYIPNVTGNEEGAINFLNELGISIKEKGKFKKLIHLDHEDMKKLVTGIILKRLGSEKNPEDILGPIYILTEEEEENPTRDAKEFSTLLNATGRLNKPSLGVGTCLGNTKIRKEAVDLLIHYKKEIIRSLNWFYNNRGSGNIIENKTYVFINAEGNVKDTLIGTLISIISKSNFYRPGTILVGMTYALDGDIKVSCRITGYRDFGVDLRKLMDKIVKNVGGLSGGHMNACGAIIPQEKEEEFIKSMNDVLGNYILEERAK